MINVLHFYKIYYPDSYGGVEQVIYQLSEGCTGKGVNSVVHTLTKNRPHKLETFGSHHSVKSKVIFEVASTPFSINAFADFKELAKSADIIHYHFPFPFMDMLHFYCGISKPTVVTYHSDILKQKNLLRIYKPLMHRFLNDVDAIVATSPNYLESSETLNRYKEKTTIIPIGINPDNYKLKSNGERDSVISKLPEKYFLFIGALRYYKGLKVLIDSVTNTDIPLVIVGSGPLEGELKKTISERNLKNVIMLGAINNDQKNMILNKSYAVVFPSQLRTEAFGITLLEGALFGKPLISCEIGTGTTFVNIHNHTGLVVTPDNSQSLKDAMVSMYNNKSMARKFGQNAKARFFELFTAEKMANSYLEVYKSLI